MPKIQKYLLVFLLASVLLVFAAVFSVDDDMHIVFCDVGQGDAILIYKKSMQVLIDGGPDSSVLSCLSDHMPFWDRKIELVVLTHADADHFTGLVEIVRRYNVGLIVTNGLRSESAGFAILENEVKNRNVASRNISAGDRIKVGDLQFDTLWPTQEWVAARSQESPEAAVLGARTSNSLNELSVVLGLFYGESLSHGDFSALLTGDIAPPATDLLADSIKDNFLVLKVPHHGSKNGLTENLLEATNPKTAVISAGKNNRYDHPHDEVIRLLGDWKVRTLRTDKDGEIHIKTDGEKWWVED